MSRGFDVAEVQLVINVDVPLQRDEHGEIPDADTFMHRSGRAGRFGKKGICLTLFDKDYEERCFNAIQEKLNLDVVELSKPELLKEKLAEVAKEYWSD